MGCVASWQAAWRLWRRWACVLQRHVSGRVRWASARSTLQWPQWRARPLPMRAQLEPPRLLTATDGCGTLLACLHGLCGKLAGSAAAVEAMDMRSAAVRERTRVVGVSTFNAAVASMACSPAADARSARASTLANRYRRVLLLASVPPRALRQAGRQRGRSTSDEHAFCSGT